MRFNNLQDWLQWIESCHPSNIELGLERMGQVYDRLQCDFKNTKVITIAGTNGKGSCVRVLEHLLLKHGLRVACYTSPHFLRYNERVRIMGEEVDDELLCASFANIDQLRGDIPLTYFEYGTLAGLDIFSNLQLDVIILEVGLGGRLDASNIVDADIAVVTNIDVDHEDWLGSDVEVIGREKSGIFRAGKIAICGDPNPPASVRETAELLGAQFYQRGKDFSAVIDDSFFNFSGQCSNGETCSISDLPEVDLPFDSVVAALQVALFLDLPLETEFYSSLSSLELTGRFQKLCYQSKNVVLDVAHNPAAAQHLADKLVQSDIAGKTYAVAAMMADKDVAAIILSLAPSIDYWYLGDLSNNPRALSAEALAEVVEKQAASDVHLCGDVIDAFERALQTMTVNDRLLVFGSFFSVAEVIKLIGTNNKTMAEGS